MGIWTGAMKSWSRTLYASLNWAIIGSGNGLSPVWCQAVTWTNADFLLITPLGTDFNEILIKIHTFPLKEMHLKIKSAKWEPFCPGLNSLGPGRCGYNFNPYCTGTESYLGLTRSISWLLMPWLLASPGHQQPWYWLCKIGKSWSYVRKNFNYVWYVSVEEWHKI